MNTEQLMALIDAYGRQMMYSPHHPLTEARAAVLAAVTEMVDKAKFAFMEGFEGGKQQERDAFVAEVDALKAELAQKETFNRGAYQSGHNDGVAHHKKATAHIVAERDALKAKLAEYESREPVAWEHHFTNSGKKLSYSPALAGFPFSGDAAKVVPLYTKVEA
jgi:hypothetical protein